MVAVPVLAEVIIVVVGPVAVLVVEPLWTNPFARRGLRGPGGGRGGDFARPYEKRGPPGNDQRFFAKPSNKPYSPQVPPATLALLVSLQGAPWRTASDFRRQLVRAGHAPVPPVDAIDGALRKHAADYGIASRVDADGRRRFTVVDKVRAARTAAARRREAREAPCTSHAAAVAEASHARVEAAARSDALFERLSRRLAAAGAVPVSFGGRVDGVNLHAIVATIRRLGAASMASSATLSTRGVVSLQACTSRARARPATRPHHHRPSSRWQCLCPAARATRRRPGRPWSRRRSRAEPRARRARASASQPCTRRTRGRRRPSIRATATGAAGAYLKPSRRRAGRRRRRTSRTRRAPPGRGRT